MCSGNYDKIFLFYNTLWTTSLHEWFTVLRMLDISLTWPHPLPQRREGIWGLALQSAVAQELISYVTRTWCIASMGHDPDTIMCESSRVRSNSALDFSHCTKLARLLQITVRDHMTWFLVPLFSHNSSAYYSQRNSWIMCVSLVWGHRLTASCSAAL